MFSHRKQLASLTQAVLLLVDAVDRRDEQLKRMEHKLTTQSEQIAQLVTGLSDRFSALDAAIQTVVAAFGNQNKPDPNLAAAITGLTSLNDHVQNDVTTLVALTAAPATEADPATVQAAQASPAPGKMDA